MKKAAGSLWVLCIAVTLTAQHKHGHHHAPWQVEDVPVTQDPFGNVVETYHHPIPDWLNPEDDPNLPLIDPAVYLAEEARRADQRAKAGFEIVFVFLAVDPEYMAEEPDWPVRTLTIFESAKMSYLLLGNIHLVFGGWMMWDSNGSSGSAMLTDLASDFSHLPNGLVIGFTDDPNFVDGDGDRLGGIAYTYSGNPGLGFCIVENQSLTNTTFALRHELGHNYGMGHDTGSEVCLMNYEYAYTVAYWDPAHQTDLIDRNHRFTFDP